MTLRGIAGLRGKIDRLEKKAKKRDDEQRVADTFRRFLPIAAGKYLFPNGLYELLLAVNIVTLTQLLRLVRERFPDFYRERLLANDGNGQQAMRRLWADFLGWLDRDTTDRTALSDFAPKPRLKQETGVKS
jgi:hypothetical protein